MPGRLAKHHANIGQAYEVLAPSMRLTTQPDRRICRELWVRFGALGLWSAGALRKREMQTVGRAGVRSSASSRLENCHAADPKV